MTLRIGDEYNGDGRDHYDGDNQGHVDDDPKCIILCSSTHESSKMQRKCLIIKLFKKAIYFCVLSFPIWSTMEAI